MGYDQKGGVELQRLNFKCEINFYKLTFGCNVAKKTKQEKTKPLKPNNPQISIQYILLTYISNVIVNTQLVLFNRLPIKRLVY